MDIGQVMILVLETLCINTRTKTEILTEKDGSILMVSILGDTPKLALHSLLQHAFVHLHIVHDDTLM